jgi:hypothetical protein
MFQISLADMDSPRKLSQAVVQATQLLGLYQAELARILHLKCADIGELANARWQLQPDTESWRQAQLFIEFFELLYRSKQGDGVAMRHWLRAHDPHLQGSPVLLMVDELRMVDVIESLARDISDTRN